MEKRKVNENEVGGKPITETPFILNFLEYQKGYGPSPTTSGTWNDPDSADTDSEPD